ncbi:MAG TPA: glycosyltransferase family A protein [Bryobacteraceae bacterium]|nr:glycosyltransferase family A protein [Bryobacteraceae bacterium]
MKRPYISVLVDTYNHERFIEEALASVLEQDLSDAEREVIVVDDGSTDRTPEIVAKFAPRARLIRKQNGGQASAFNAGIPECKGEIVAFLDGDDWWAPGKLRAVADALASDKDVGLVGHGITEVFPDGRHHAELLRDTPRFRLTSRSGAESFRLRKSFLGTSRMTYRAQILREIGRVPETLRFQADEYLFTLAGLLADVLILRASLTFYRLHDANLFQLGDGNAEAVRRKSDVMAALARALREEMRRRDVAGEIADVVVGWVQNEADQLSLLADGGMPWKTVRTELNTYRVTHPSASTAHWIFKCATLLPACVIPPRTYYSWRRQFAKSPWYRRTREKWLPYLQPGHVDRYRRQGT